MTNNYLYYGSYAGDPGSKWGVYITGEDYNYFSGDVRAPIFYDSNDTGYYVDPNGTSQTRHLKIFPSGITNDVWNNSIEIREVNGVTNTQTGSDYAPSIYFHWSNVAAAAIKMYSDGQIRIRGQSTDSTDYRHVYMANLYSYIFYDNHDTGYYVDPSSISNVNRIYAGYAHGADNSIGCSNWFRSSGTSGWYNGTYGGGIHMTDTTWVRVYNSKAFYVANEIAATGNITAYYSDERLKTKLGNIENSLDIIKSLNGFRYVNNDLAKENGYTDEKVQLGLSAQEVEAVLPEVVSLAPFDYHTDEETGEITSKSGENYKTLDYAKLVPVLIEAMKEQQKQIEDLRNEIDTLKGVN